MRQQTPLRALGAFWVSAWRSPLRRPSTTFFTMFYCPLERKCGPLDSSLPCSFTFSRWCFMTIFVLVLLYILFCILIFPFSNCLTVFPPLYIFSINYCLFVHWLYVLFCMVPLCMALLPLLFRSFLLGPACRVLLFIFALNYILFRNLV